MKKRIGIYGGTFNPCHRGHVLAAENFVKLFDLDMLYVIPANIPPHKQVDGFISAEHRYNMLRCVFEGHEKTEVSDYEISKSGISYTFETLRHFSPLCDELYMLVGSDMFLSLDTWKNPELIFSLCTVVCFSRTDGDREELLSKKDLLEKRYGAKIEIPEYKAYEVSSTEIRQLISDKEKMKELIPARALEYIEENCLYLPENKYGEADIDYLKRDIKDKLLPERYVHTLGVEDTAKRICDVLGLDESISYPTRIGALLHDIAKMYPQQQQVQMCEKFGYMMSEEDKKSPATLHARNGAYLAKQLYPELADGIVCGIIDCHCTGKPKMNIAEKIVFLSDYIEPGRKYKNCIFVRDFFFSEEEIKNPFLRLDTAVFLAYDLTVKSLRKKNFYIHPDTLSGREYMIQKGIQNVRKN